VFDGPEILMKARILSLLCAVAAAWSGPADRIGSIAVGKIADLVVVKGDPAARIADVENVEIVFKDGAGYDPKRLLDSVKGRYGEY
jgi:imidazolonepropionase-like amidohydrolase